MGTKQVKIIIKIKFDRKTLPADRQKVAWQTLYDLSAGKWKTGIYDAGSQSFLIGFEPVINNWDHAGKVIHWKKY